MNCYSLMEFHHLYLYLFLYLIKDHPLAEHFTGRIWFCICFYICLWQPIGVRPIFTIWLESNGKNNDGMHSPRADLVSMDMVKEIWTFFFNKNKNRTERQLMENATSQVFYFSSSKVCFFALLWYLSFCQNAPCCVIYVKSVQMIYVAGVNIRGSYFPQVTTSTIFWRWQRRRKKGNRCKNYDLGENLKRRLRVWGQWSLWWRPIESVPRWPHFFRRSKIFEYPLYYIQNGMIWILNAMYVSFC